MTTTTEQLNIRVDSETKRGAERVLSDLGLSTSVAINVFLRKVYKEGGLPFQVNDDRFYSELNVKYLQEVIDDFENGRTTFTEHDLIEVED